MRKISWILIICLCFGVLAGCGAKKLSGNYNEEALKTATETILKNLDNKSFEDIEATMSDEMKKAVSAGKLEEAWASFSKYGKYDSISKIVFVEKDKYVSVVAKANYENGKIQYTLSFDKDMKLVGFFLK